MGRETELSPKVKKEIIQILNKADRGAVASRRKFIKDTLVVSGAAVGSLALLFYGTSERNNQAASPEALAAEYNLRLRTTGTRVEVVQGILRVDSRLLHAPIPQAKLFGLKSVTEKKEIELLNTLVYRIPFSDPTDSVKYPPFLVYLSPETMKAEFFPLTEETKPYIRNSQGEPLTFLDTKIGQIDQYARSKGDTPEIVRANVSFSREAVPVGKIMHGLR